MTSIGLFLFCNLVWLSRAAVDQLALESSEVYFPVLLPSSPKGVLDDSFVREKISKLKKPPKADPRPPSEDPLPSPGKPMNQTTIYQTDRYINKPAALRYPEDYINLPGYKELVYHPPIPTTTKNPLITYRPPQNEVTTHRFSPKPTLNSPPKYQSITTNGATSYRRPQANQVSTVRIGGDNYRPMAGSKLTADYDMYVPVGYREDDFSGIPGIPGQNYPIFSYPPQTSFFCGDQKYPGFYADTEAYCQVFHICQADGRANAFLCPNGTLFNQQYFVCDWWYNVNCGNAISLYVLNAYLYRDVYRPNYKNL